MHLYSRTVSQLIEELKKLPQDKDVTLLLRLNKNDLIEVDKWKNGGGTHAGFEFSIFTIVQDSFGDVELNGFDPSGSYLS